MYLNDFIFFLNHALLMCQISYAQDYFQSNVKSIIVTEWRTKNIDMSTESIKIVNNIWIKINSIIGWTQRYKSEPPLCTLTPTVLLSDSLITCPRLPVYLDCFIIENN